MSINTLFAKVASLPDRVALDDLRAQQDDRTFRARSLNGAREKRDAKRAELEKVREHRRTVEEELGNFEFLGRPSPEGEAKLGTRDKTDLKEMRARAGARIQELEALLGRLRFQVGRFLRGLEAEDRRVAQKVEGAKQVQEERKNAIEVAP